MFIKLLSTRCAIVAAFSLTMPFLSARAEQGQDNPTGVNGVYNGNVTSGGSYDPYTGNAVRVIDDIVVPGTVGSYPLKWTRTFNSRMTYQFNSTGGQWRFSYLNYAYKNGSCAGSGTRVYGPVLSPPSLCHWVRFPDGRVIDFTQGDIPGVAEINQEVMTRGI